MLIGTWSHGRVLGKLCIDGKNVVILHGDLRFTVFMASDTPFDQCLCGLIIRLVDKVD